MTLIEHKMYNINTLPYVKKTSSVYIRGEPLNLQIRLVCVIAIKTGLNPREDIYGTLCIN